MKIYNPEKSPKIYLKSHNIKIGKNTKVLWAEIKDNVSIGYNTLVNVGCYIFFDVKIQNNCKIGKYVNVHGGTTIYHHVKIMDNSYIPSYSIIPPYSEVKYMYPYTVFFDLGLNRPRVILGNQEISTFLEEDKNTWIYNYFKELNNATLPSYIQYRKTIYQYL